jgi:probable HAF family extracellular repeat protein
MKRNVQFWSVFGSVVRQTSTKFKPSKIAFLCLFLFTIHVRAEKKVLFYGPTYNPDGKAEQLVETSSEFWHVNTGPTRSEVWTPGDPVAAKDWSKKTTADFAAFDAIIFSDLQVGGAQIEINPTPWTGAIANVSVWSAAVTGNVLLFAGDPEAHAGTLCGCGPLGSFPLQGAQDFIEDAVRFVTAAGHGLYLPLSAINPNLPSPVNSTRKCVEHLLSGLGNFSAVPIFANKVRRLYQSPLLLHDIDAETQMSGWGASAHSGFTAWPAAYKPLALVTDVAPEKRTSSALLPPGEIGSVHILAKSASLRLFYLTPPYSGRARGSKDTFTAWFKDSNGNGFSGKPVSFSVVNPPSANSASGSGSTLTDGSRLFFEAYTGANAGRDTVTAIVTESPGVTYTATRTVVWAENVVTIASNDPNAGEPATQGGTADTGTFTISRGSPPPATSLTVDLTLNGTATANIDYDAPPLLINDADPPAGVPATVSVTIPANASSVNLVIRPLFDGLSEISETVIAKIVDRDDNRYAIGEPSEATITIASSTVDTITLGIDDASIAETAEVGQGNDNPALLRLQRTGTSGNVDITLEFSGVASFGDDYIINGLNADNTATIADGDQFALIEIVAIPDSRSEGTSESVTVTVKASPTGQYAVGGPLTQTVYILDDDPQQLPSLGWKLTDLGIFGGSFGYAYGINTIPAGGGQLRGHVAGFYYSYTAPNYKGALWDNGSYSYRNWPSSFPVQQGAVPWSHTWGLNNNPTVVGDCGYYYASDGYHQWASYWNAGSSAPVLLPLLPGTTEIGQNNYAYAINQRDYDNDTGAIIVGVQKNSSGINHAVIWVAAADETYPSGGLVELGDIGDGARASVAYGINQRGEVVGKSQIASSSVYHAFRTDFVDGIPQFLSTLVGDMGTATFVPSHSSQAEDINDYGELVGASQFPGNVYHAAYKSSGTSKNLGWYRLGVLGENTANAGTQSIARGINKNGLIVGKSQIKVNNVMVWHGFVASNQGTPGSQLPVDLNSNSYVWLSGWYPVASDGWVIDSAEKINGGNWIVGMGTKNGAQHAIILSPR